MTEKVYRIHNTKLRKFSFGNHKWAFGKVGKIYNELQQVWAQIRRTFANKTHPTANDKLDELEIVEYELVERRRIPAREILSEVPISWEEYLKFGEVVVYRNQRRLVERTCTNLVHFQDGTSAPHSEVTKISQPGNPFGT